MRYAWLTLKHKWFVFLAGLKTGANLWDLVTHDMSKFSLQELPHYQRQFFGKADDPLGFSHAWNHHQKANKHHHEYWFMISGHSRGGYPDMQPIPMPVRYVREMVADWLGAGRVYEGKWPDMKDWPWFLKNNVRIYAGCHKTTRILIQCVIRELEFDQSKKDGDH